ncbi:MAG: hypothetical protein AAFQ90_03405 [Pseudomonadota bacterium]
MTASSQAAVTNDEDFVIGASQRFARPLRLVIRITILICAFAMIVAWGWLGLVPAFLLSAFFLTKMSPTRERWKLTAEGVDFGRPHGPISWWSIGRIHLGKARVRVEYRYISDEMARYMREKLKEGICITPADQYRAEIRLLWTGVNADDVEKAVTRFWPEELGKPSRVLVHD